MGDWACCGFVAFGVLPIGIYYLVRTVKLLTEAKPPAVSPPIAQPPVQQPPTQASPR
jgi:hypothetical protein